MIRHSPLNGPHVHRFFNLTTTFIIFWRGLPLVYIEDSGTSVNCHLQLDSVLLKKRWNLGQITNSTLSVLMRMLISPLQKYSTVLRPIKRQFQAKNLRGHDQLNHLSSSDAGSLLSHGRTWIPAAVKRKNVEWHLGRSNPGSQMIYFSFVSLERCSTAKELSPFTFPKAHHSLSGLRALIYATRKEFRYQLII